MKKILISIFSAMLLGCISLFAQTSPDKDYLCFTATGASSVTLNKNGSPAEVTLQTSKDGTNWSDSDYAFGTPIDLADGEKVYFRNKGTATTFSQSSSNYYQFALSGNVAASGNIMSLLDINCSITDISNSSYDFCFSRLFQKCTCLTAAPELPATKLSNRCYQNMFFNCTSLVTAPAELPATALASSCYLNMFINCTSLVTAPAELPAETLAEDCYGSMFGGCTNLKTAPALPATTLASGCCSSMFDGCTSLETAPALPATTLANACYMNMFQGCKNLKATPELPAKHLPNQCYFGMFKDCINLTTAELPETTFDNANPMQGSCYQMFYGCTNLNSVKVAFTKGLGRPNTEKWLNGVASTGTFVCPAELDVSTRDVDNVPAGWSVTYDITAKQDPDNKENYYATFYCSGAAYKLPNNVSAYYGEKKDGKLNLFKIEGDIIPAGEGVILKLTTDNTEAKVHFLLEESTETGTKDTNNALTGTDSAISSAPAGTKAFSLGESGVGFYLWTGKPIAAHKAYIPAAAQE